MSMEQSHNEQKSSSLIPGPSYYAQSLVRYCPWVACPRFECCSQSQRHCGWSCCCCSVTQLRPTLWDPMDCSMPDFPVLHSLPDSAQIYIHWVSDAIQPSSVIPFSCLQPYPASGSFPMSRLFASGGQSIGASASASVLPMNIQGPFLEFLSWVQDRSSHPSSSLLLGTGRSVTCSHSLSPGTALRDQLAFLPPSSSAVVADLFWLPCPGDEIFFRCFFYQRRSHLCLEVCLDSRLHPRWRQW